MKLVQLYILFFVLLSVSINAQTTYQQANYAFTYKEYSKAITLYKKALKVENNTDVINNIHFRLAESYKNTNQYNDALTSYDLAIKNGLKTNEVLVGYQQCLLYTGNYTEALAQLDAYLKMNTTDNFAQLLFESSRFASKNTIDKSVTVKNESKINSANSDFSPVVINDKLFFTSTRPGNYNKTWSYTGQSFSDFYQVKYNAKSPALKNPELSEGPINSPYNDGTITYNKTTDDIYFMQCNGIDGTQQTCQVYVTKHDKKKKNWDKIKRVSLGPNSFSYGHPALSPDGNTLYFVSDMTGSVGGKDIWKVTKENEQWGKAVNLGTAINTVGDECYPFLIGDTLCFSSNGHAGYGGLDIFISKITNDFYSQPDNLLQPINSSTDDFGIYFFDNQNGLFSSNRTGGQGDDDIYSFQYIRINASGIITDTAGLPIKGAIVTLKSSDSTAIMAFTDSAGAYSFKSLEPNKNFTVHILKSGFDKDSLTFNTNNISSNAQLNKSTGYNLDVRLKPTFVDTVPKIDSSKIMASIDSASLNKKIEDESTKKDSKIKLVKENERVKKIIVYYALSKWNVYKTNKPELDYVVRYMKNHPEENVLLDSHTDERSSDEFNLNLSRKRAMDVIQYMVKNGIDSSRMAYKAWGETTPVVKNAKREKDHQLNRRTEFNFELKDDFTRLTASGSYSPAHAAFIEEKIINQTSIASAEPITTPTETKVETPAKPVTPITTLKPRQSNKEKVAYSVQFASYKEKVDPSVYKVITDKFPGFEIEIYKNNNDDTYKYTIGRFQDFNDALSLMNKIRESGNPCFLTAYYKNKRISVPEAKRLLN